MRRSKNTVQTGIQLDPHRYRFRGVAAGMHLDIMIAQYRSSLTLCSLEDKAHMDVCALSLLLAPRIVDS